MVKLLLEFGANLDAQDKEGRKPLSYAVHEGNTAMVKFLRELGTEHEHELLLATGKVWFDSRDAWTNIVSCSCGAS
jgi:ankyrin repeat protein